MFPFYNWINKGKCLLLKLYVSLFQKAMESQTIKKKNNINESKRS